MRHCAAFWSWVFSTPAGGWLIVLGLLIYLAVSSFSVGYKLAFIDLWGVAGGASWLKPSGSTTGSKAGAVVIWVGLGVVRTWFLLCWAIAVARSYSPKTRLSGRKSVQQSDIDTWRGYRPARPSNNTQRLRFCKRNCPARDEPLADRVYHCSYIQTLHEKGLRRDACVHLPLYDHFCPWLRICVYLDTIKPYLLSILFLVLDATLVLITSIIAMSRHKRSSAVVHAPATFRAVAVVIFLAFSNLWFKFEDLALRNVTLPEESQMEDVGFCFAISLDRPHDHHAHTFASYIGNPWDLGWRKNLSQAFRERVWDCLLPWTQPPRVLHYADRHQVTDFEMSDRFWDWVAEKRAEWSGPAASRSAATDHRRGADTAGASTHAGTSTVAFSPRSPSPSLPRLSLPTIPPLLDPHEIPLPSSPRELSPPLSRLSPPTIPPPLAPHEIPLPSSPSEI